MRGSAIEMSEVVSLVSSVKTKLPIDFAGSLRLGCHCSGHVEF